MRATSHVRRYSELIMLPTFEERFAYLKLSDGKVGADTFGHLRWLNQLFYTSTDYRKLRRDLIIRDFGGDMGLKDFPIDSRRIILHHMNPIDDDDIINRSPYAWDPEYIICVSQDTHNAIHFGTDVDYTRSIIERRPNDTCPWKQ